MAPDTPSDPPNPDRVQISAPLPHSNISNAPSALHHEAFAFYPPRDDSADPHPNQNGQPLEHPNANNGASLSYPAMPVFPYGNVVPPPPGIPRPKRTQCKNACTNCQKACKKCDDNRPCQRCIRYGTTDTCVDSQRKERKKGIKRGPYKKRDGKGSGTADADSEDTNRLPQAVQGPPPNMPYIGPVGYPPGLWSTYTHTGHGGKLEAAGFYQPVFALTPVGGPPPNGGEGGSASGGTDSPHFPVSFYPATFISYPGPFPPYPISQAPGAVPQGFHFAYPPPIFAARPPQVANANGDQNADNNNSANVPVKENADASMMTGSGKDKDADSQVNGQVKVAQSQGNGDAAGREAD